MRLSCCTGGWSPNARHVEPIKAIEGDGECLRMRQNGKGEGAGAEDGEAEKDECRPFRSSLG